MPSVIAPSPDRGTGIKRRLGSTVLVDCSIVLLVFLLAWTTGTMYWNRAVAGHLPFFYQSYFEPAVMIACGKGFVIAHPQVPAMSAFLTQKVDQFSCDAIPRNAVLGTQYLYQNAWRYLMYAVGITWRIRGVSWNRLGPLFGFLYAMTCAGLYAVLRLGMGPKLALLGSLALDVSKLHLAYLPILRDYAKAPFTLILIFLLGLLVTRPSTWRNVLGAAAAYGVVLGIGYGFRSDFLVNIPPFFVALVFFLEGGPFRNIGLKIAAGAVFVATFLVSAWPIVSSVYSGGGCQWHAALLGFSSNFSRPLGVDEPPYQLSRRYSDEFAYATVTSYAARVHPGVGHIEYCQAPYDAATSRYLRDLASRFPADLVIRGYASVLRVTDLTFTWRRTQPEDADDLTSDDAPARQRYGLGIALAILAIGLTTAVNVRLGLFLLFFLLYFAGYPAAQFDARHYFHLEFITWWAVGFLLQSAARPVWQLVREPRWDRAIVDSSRRAVIVLGACAAVLVMTLWGARAYQQIAARSLFGSYLSAAREQIVIEEGSPGTPHPIPRAAPGTDPQTADFIEVDVNDWRCGDRPAVTFAYDRATREFSRTFRLQRHPDARGPTHIFMPVYDGFQTIQFSDTRPGCVDGVYRVRYEGHVSVLLETVLAPRWENEPLYQRLGTVGRHQPDALP